MKVSIDAVIEALGQIKYPGYDRDILSLGLIDSAQPTPEGGFAIVIRQATENEQVMRTLVAQIHHQLSHELGVEKLELKARKVEAELGEKTGRVHLEGTKHVIAVASGKGGVGKSTVAANLAAALARLGLSVGLLDADIYGPSVGIMFGTGQERPHAASRERFYPLHRHGVNLVSMAFFLGERAPVIWRGPMVMGAVRQFLKDAIWGTQDFLIIDLPPGTGDAQLTVAQQVHLDGAVIVSTPQDLALLDAMRAVKMFRQVHCPILGIVENMSYFECPDCGDRATLFGSGGGQRMAQSEHSTLLARIPIYREIRETGDSGAPITVAQPDHPASVTFMELAHEIVAAMPDPR